MSKIPNCPKCESEYTYEDGSVFVCPDCGHEFTAGDSVPEPVADEPQYRDAFGTPLEDGDTVTVIKDLKVGGSSNVLKVGTKVKNIRLCGGDHDIDCKIPGFGGMKLKCSVVKKA
ncbi:zinc ribbon domain-containing protein YjdM [Coraliomargarita parva]|uniref:zinc ribbon domain-containing protein YjdM n=1 Tax=Coraliomargarita parva TaxID=3014050 RepID=UPI0022B5726B|nr:zinc ribbon domain-containing protein YjdM [Coraliomargarita parva]